MADGKIAKNVKAREAVDELLTFVPEVIKGADEERFWECLAKEAASHIGQVLADDGMVNKPMSDAEAEKFENTTRMSKGKFQGELIKDIDLNYLGAWLGDTFSRNMQRYLKSDRFRRKLGW